MRFAVKVLTRSDLTFFEPQFRQRNAGNQKSINLNRRVLVDELFPELPALMAEGDGEIQVRLRICGPGSHHGEIRVVRKITKGEAYKNYRLNGEFVRNPEDAAGRFDGLVPGDLALLAFEGAGRPRQIRLFVLAAAEPDDAGLVRALLPSGGASMITLEAEVLARALAAAPPQHPVHDLFLDPALAADLEQAALGEAGAAERLLKAPGSRRVSAEQLADARRRAEMTGHEGELLIRGLLEREPGAASWSWRSSQNAISPYDFELVTQAGVQIRVEVKTTTGPHETPFHISMAEIRAAASGGRYDLYRLSEIGPPGARLQVAEDVGVFARHILEGLTGLPAGVRPDGFTIEPAALNWSRAREVSWPETEDE